MSDFILYPNSETGGVCILCPCDESLTLEQVADKDVPSGQPYKIVNYDDLPVDKNFIDAWEVDFNDPQDNVSINIDKAREIHKQNIRVARIPKLQELDVQFMRGLEVGGDTSYVEMKKNLLRDATQTSEIQSAVNVEELKNSWDSILLGPSPYA